MTTTPSQVPVSLPTSTSATLSLVAGILGLTLLPFIGSILAVVLGYAARREIVASAGAIGGGGLATAGIVLGWIGIALGVLGFCGGLLFGVLLPLCGFGACVTIPFLNPDAWQGAFLPAGIALRA